MDRGRSTQFAGLVDRSLRRICSVAIVAAALNFHPSGAHAAPPDRPRLSFAPVLIYHHVTPLKPSDDAIERGLTVLPSQFESQLKYLRAARYHVVTAAQLVRHLLTGAALPTKPVVLTFDDGYVDMYHGAYERLLRAHMKGTFFIVPSFLGTPRYLTWHQIQIMAAHGMDIEAHTMTHPDLTRIGPRSVKWQLQESRRELQLGLHHAVNILAYPYGAYNSRVIVAVSRAGYKAAFTTREGWTASSSSLLSEPRIYVDLDDSAAIFAGRIRDDARAVAQDPT